MTDVDSPKAARPRRVWRFLPTARSAIIWSSVLAVSVAASYSWSLLGSRTMSPIWLGLAPQLVALLYAPRRHWPALLGVFALVQTVVIAVLIGRFPPGIGIPAGAAAAAAGAVMLTSQRQPPPDAERGAVLRAWLAFAVTGIVLCPAVSTLVATVDVLVTAPAPLDWHYLWTRTGTWFLANAVGVAYLTPVLLGLRYRVRGRRPTPRTGRSPRIAVLGVWSVFPAAVAALVLATDSIAWLGLTLFSLTAVGVVKGFRYLPPGAFLAAVVTLMGTATGLGPFDPANSRATALIHAQVFLLVMAVLLAVMATLVEASKRDESLAKASFTAYEMIARLSNDIVTVRDRTGAVAYCSPNAVDILGIDLTALDADGWQNMLEPDDSAPDTSTTSETEESSVRIETVKGWASFRAFSRRTVDGMSVTILRDVTVQRTREQALRAEAEELGVEASTDALTSLLNRRGLHRYFPFLDDVARAAGTPLSMLFVDVDFFKEFNDRYGHHDGDLCLAQLAEICARTTRTCHRSDGLCARYGGEEFVLVLRGDAVSAHTAATRLCEAVRLAAIPHLGSPHRFVSVSIGVAISDPAKDGAHCDVVLDRLLTQSDHALYVAKRTGRNRVCAYEYS